MGLPDKYFSEMSPVDLVTAVGTLTLATISTYNHKELTRLGWYDNPLVPILYGLTSAGVWIARTNASGQETEANSAAIQGASTYIKQNTMIAVHPTVMDPTVSISSSLTPLLHIRSAVLHFATDGAGAAAAQALHTGPAGFYPVVRLKRLISDVADAATTLQRTVTGGALVGGANRVVAIVANVSLDLGDELLYNLTDASVISLAIDAGPISAHIYLEYEYWSET